MLSVPCRTEIVPGAVSGSTGSSRSSAWMAVFSSTQKTAALLGGRRERPIAICALIAATYTPFAVGPLRAHGGILLFALEWLLTPIGVGFVLCGGLDRTRVSNALYIGMG